MGAVHSDETKWQAMMRYAQGEMPERIAEQMGVDAGTISRWRSKKVPSDWDAERAKVQEAAAAEVRKKLADKKSKIAIGHFDTLDYLHSHIKRQLLRQKDGAAPGVMELNPNLSPNDLQKLARSFAIVQGGQRLIFGESTYIVGEAGVSKAAAGGIPDLPDDLVREIDLALAKAAANPGEPIDGSKDDDE